MGLFSDDEKHVDYHQADDFQINEIKRRVGNLERLISGSLSSRTDMELIDELRRRAPHVLVIIQEDGGKVRLTSTKGVFDDCKRVRLDFPKASNERSDNGGTECSDA